MESLRYAVGRNRWEPAARWHMPCAEGPAPVLVLNGDTLNIDLGEADPLVCGASVPVAMMLKQTPDVARYGAVKLVDDRVAGNFAEKARPAGTDQCRHLRGDAGSPFSTGNVG